MTVFTKDSKGTSIEISDINSSPGSNKMLSESELLELYNQNRKEEIMSSLEEKLKKVGVSLAVSGLTIYGLRNLGVIDWLMNYEISTATYLGEWAKNIAESTAPIARVFYGGLLSGLTGFATYHILKKQKTL